MSLPGGSGAAASPPPRKPAAADPAKASPSAPSTSHSRPQPTAKTPPRPEPKPEARPDETFVTEPGQNSDEDLARSAQPDVDATFATQPPAESSEADSRDLDSTTDFSHASSPASAASSAEASEDTEMTGGYLPQPAREDVDQTAALPDVSAAFAGADRGDAAGGDPESTTEFGTQARPSPARSPAPSKTTTGKPAAKAAAKKPAAKEAEADADDIPEELGGYEILKQLGRGGMGAVYLARQISLDRPVALKVMNAKIAEDARFVARFVREAYAAAQLTHHNIVQIYDIGTEKGINYFSMEFVRGGSLGDTLKKCGKLPAAEAVGYILQAARGLKFAHERGMVHRDIKPDNLMLNTDGIVKVADMGLIKTRGMSKSDDEPSGGGMEKNTGSLLQELPDVTNVGSAMGSPSYMAPEQARDASSVDQRADIYSLGCTLYALISGRTPFQGKTAVEVITKHLNEPPPPIQSVAKDVPKPLAEIVNRTLMKEPEKRFQSMEELIEALKGWQESSSVGPPKPTDEQITLFEGLARKLADNPKARLAQRVALIAPLVGLVGSLLAFFLISPAAGAGGLLCTAAAVLAGVISSGLLTRSYLFTKVRQWVFGARLADWLMLGFAALLFLLVIIMAGLFSTALLSILFGSGLGVGYGFLLARPAANVRLDQKDDLDGVLKRLRLQGIEEEAVRRFAIVTAGDQWEVVYETLFGYEEKVQARRQYAEETKGRPAFGGWRDPVIARLDGLLEARKRAAAQKLLQKVEAARLKAEGVSEAEARAKARDAAEDLVEAGAEIKAANQDAKKKVNVRQIMSRYEKAKSERPPRPRKNPLFEGVKNLLLLPLDSRLRLVLGALLLLAGLLWIRQEAAAVPVKPGQSLSLIEKIEPSIQAGGGKPLSLSWLPFDPPGELMQLFDCANPVLAGALLVLSALATRGFPLFVVIFGAVTVFLGHRVGLPLPADLYGFKPSHLAASAGVTIALFAMIVLGSDSGRGRDVDED